MLQEATAKAKKEVRFPREESRISKGSLGASGEGSSEDRRENWIQRTGPILKTRRAYESVTDEEYDPKDQSRMRKKRIARNEDSDMERWGKRQIRFDIEHLRIKEVRQLRRPDIKS